MDRSRGATRRPEAQRMRRSSNGIEDVSVFALDARYVFQHSLLWELHGVALPPASERMVARCDDITGGFQRLEFCEFVSQAHD